MFRADSRQCTNLSKGGERMPNERPVVSGDDMLSQADIILPTQYFESIGSRGLSGEQRLMLAVMVDAINVLQNWKGTGSPRKRRNFAEAAQWVNTRGTGHPFSFDSVCDALEIHSELLRSRLRTLTVRPANSPRRLALARLRLKELSRSQHITTNRLRRHQHAPYVMSAMNSRASCSSPRLEVHVEQAQDSLS
jgi:hypothetical protein